MKKFVFYLLICFLIYFNQQSAMAEEENDSEIETSEYNDKTDYCLDPYVDYENKDKLKTNEEIIKEMDLALQDSLNQFEDCIEINYQGAGGGSGGAGGGSGGAGGGSGGAGGGSGGGSDNKKTVKSEGNSDNSADGSKTNDLASEDGSIGGSSGGQVPIKSRQVQLDKSDIGQKPKNIEEQDKDVLSRQIKELCDSLTEENEKNKCLDEYKKYK